MVRIVKLTIDPGKAKAFEGLFTEKMMQIRNFPGCSHLALWKSHLPTGVFMTYSIWDDQEALDAYRHSAMFSDIWTTIKPWFTAKPEAWSLDDITPLP